MSSPREAILSRIPRYLLLGGASWLAFKAYQFKSTDESAALLAVGMGFGMVCLWAVLFCVDRVGTEQEVQAS